MQAGGIAFRVENESSETKGAGGKLNSDRNLNVMIPNEDWGCLYIVVAEGGVLINTCRYVGVPFYLGSHKNLPPSVTVQHFPIY